MHTPSCDGVTRRAGFSLIELAIVLVILGLLVGGIMTGKSLIRAAELRSVAADLERYKYALINFEDRYDSIPGDMPNATVFWGAAHASLSTCIATNSGDKRTCDGNGDGSVGPSGSTCYERHRFWHHLANADLIIGRFSGIAGSAGACHSTLGTTPNSARSKLSRTGFSFVSVSDSFISGHHSYFDGVWGQRLFFGKQDDSEASSLWNATLEAGEAYNIDTKIDDGKPAYGLVQSYKRGASWGTSNCTTTASSASSQYDFTTSNVVCALMFIVGR